MTAWCRHGAQLAIPDKSLNIIAQFCKKVAHGILAHRSQDPNHFHYKAIQAK
jgi:hypothetical protein